VYDLTIAHVTAPSHANSTPAAIIAEKTAKKKALYEPLLGDEPFVVLPARGHGKAEESLRDLIRTLAGMAEKRPADLYEELSVELARGVGLSLVEARRPKRR
jgi:hypothetical protein